MPERPLRFFFYGTLIAGSGNAVADDVHARLRNLGPATVRGRLYAIPDPQGWYPALLPGDAQVHGRLYEAATDFSAADLAALDAWEDCDPREPETSLYLRNSWPVTCGGRSLEAEVYRFNQPLPDVARPIPDGDFHAWLTREGLRPFA